MKILDEQVLVWAPIQPNAEWIDLKEYLSPSPFQPIPPNSMNENI